ncbi:tail fiber domain-containing protein [Emticicia sp.]|uniref:tail fiber domain-containing protein n=1 Tax=Emticicia sp. TaxID=1930953 RepID=UPI003751BDBD
MKNLLSLSLILSFSVQFFGYSQDPSPDRWYDNGDNTNVNIPPNGRINLLRDAENSSALEEFKRFKVSDAPYDFLSIRNATVTNNNFIPWIFAHNQTDARVSLFISGVTNYDYDTGSEPVIVFDARKYTDPNTSLAGGAAISNRSLFQWRNYITNYMTLSANGSLGIGVTTPQAQLHTTGTVRFGGLSDVAGNSLIMSDGGGNISRYNLPASSLVAFATTSPTINSLPRFNSSNVLVNSQIFDNGVNIGIGGSPAVNAKVTVYGVVNTLSDIREKTNITPIENALEKLNQINGYNYNWKNSDEKQIGLIAQEVEKVLPEAVSENTAGIKFLNYDGIIPVLTEAIKQQQKLIEAQSKQIEALSKDIEQLKKKK